MRFQDLPIDVQKRIRASMVERSVTDPYAREEAEKQHKFFQALKAEGLHRQANPEKPWQPYLRGRATLYNIPTEPSPDGKRYQFHPGCFVWAGLDLIWNHDERFKLARSPDGMRLTTDSRGLIFEARPE